jgi:hypothetical protein
VTNEERLETAELLERERAAVHLMSHGAITDTADRWTLLGLVVRPGEFTSAEGEQ